MLLILIIPLGLVSCDEEDVKPSDIKSNYSQMVSNYSEFFGTTVNDNKMVKISYPTDISTYVNQSLSACDSNVEYRYVALNLGLQNILNYVFNYYQNWSESFYSNITDVDYDQDKINKLSNLQTELNNQFKIFKESKIEFENEISVFEVATPHETTVKLFTYQYNILIEKSIDFVDYFIYLHTLYVAKENLVNYNSAQRMVDQTYFNLAKLTYMENIKPFNYVYGANGLCDLSDIIKEYKNGENEYVLLDEIEDDVVIISSSLDVDLKSEVVAVRESAERIVSTLIYYLNTYNQNFEVFENIYDDLDFYNLVQYRFDIITGSTLDDFISRYNASQSSSYYFEGLFIEFVLEDYISAFNTVINI